jgi:hypothetical protein
MYNLLLNDFIFRFLVLSLVRHQMFIYRLLFHRQVSLMRVPIFLPVSLIYNASQDGHLIL